MASIWRWHLFKLVAHRWSGPSRAGGWWRGPGGIAATGQDGLGNGLGLFGRSLDLALTKITSSGVSWNTRLKLLGVHEAHREQGQVHGQRDAQGNLQGEALRRAVGIFTGPQQGWGSGAVGVVHIDGDGNRAGHGARASVLVVHRGIVAGVLRVVQARREGAVQCPA